MRTFLMTSRFNNASWFENCRFRIKQPTIDCVYCSPKLVTDSIPTDAPMIVLEMNNDTNKIIGIGLTRNHHKIKAYSVYSNHNWNRYVYTGTSRIDRSSMTDEEETVLRALDFICFRGNRHMKRGQGLTSFPVDTLCRCAYNHFDIIEFLEDMFIRRNGIDKNSMLFQWTTSTT